jgi:hypothetical protein
MDFHNLSNEEIVHIFHQNKEVVDKHHNLIKNGLVTRPLQTNVGVVYAQVPLTPEDISEIKKCSSYVMANNIANKLEPIVLLISEAQPELVQPYQSNHSPVKC